MNACGRYPRSSKDERKSCREKKKMKKQKNEENERSHTEGDSPNYNISITFALIQISIFCRFRFHTQQVEH